jgi:hypothetical protein
MVKLKNSGQFHQHFTQAFFIPKCFAQLSVVTFQLYNFWRKNIGAKCACKMLMKLKPWRHGTPQETRVKGIQHAIQLLNRDQAVFVVIVVVLIRVQAGQLSFSPWRAMILLNTFKMILI